MNLQISNYKGRKYLAIVRGYRDPVTKSDIRQHIILKKIVKAIFSENTLFLEEGKNVLIEEFGKDYGNYFSILMLIASSKTSRSEMESIMNISIGGFLEKLENEFGLIAKVRPVMSKPAGKNVKYRIIDNYLSFWFRFIFKYRSAVELGKISITCLLCLPCPAARWLSRVVKV